MVKRNPAFVLGLPGSSKPKGAPEPVKKIKADRRK